MKRALNFCMVLVAMLLMTGCGDKFEPTETTVFVTSKGKVYSAVMESFEEAYYSFDELKGDVETAIKSYCLDVNKEAITMESLIEENDVVTLRMQYETVADYADFNDVILFSGTLSEAIAAGYEPGDLLDTEGNAVQVDPGEQGDLKIIVTEENICIQTSGKIRYVSDNVTVVDKKLAKALEAGKTHLAFVLYK